MSGVGLLFAGQGAQTPGMARDIYEKYPTARNIIDEACKILGFDIRKIMFEGPAEKLTATDISQPAIYLHSYSAFTVVKESGWFKKPGNAPVGAAGLSLGEYSALAAAGYVDWRDGLKLIYRRGQLMQEACVKHPGTMASVLGLEEADCRAACEAARSKGVVTVANLNSPGQVVISGETAAVEEASRILREKGAKRVIALQVAGAFHSPLMEDAVQGLKKALEAVSFKTSDFPVAANVTGSLIESPDKVKELLLRQLSGTVRFSDCLTTLRTAGAKSFIEFGPGKVLSGLAKRTVKDAPAAAAGTADEIAALTGKEG